jgi:type III secretory pathway lipoprotein EscJ
MADNAPARGLPLYAQLPPAARQLLLLIGLAAAVAAGVALVLWSQGTQYSPLYTGLADRDAGEIAAMLDSSGVPYKLEAGGALSVPADRKHEVRMQLAGAGLPRGTGFGIEEMTERSSFGQTPFMENALYVKAFETELARSIGSMQPVEAARVHLALPPPAVFARQKREPSASVMLQLYPGRRLDPAQVQAVVHLVASSVPELSPSRVTVVDQTGALLTNGAADSTAQLTATQFEYRKQVEEAYAQRIEGLLASVAGPIPHCTSGNKFVTAAASKCAALCRQSARASGLSGVTMRTAASFSRENVRSTRRSSTTPASATLARRGEIPAATSRTSAPAGIVRRDPSGSVIVTSGIGRRDDSLWSLVFGRSFVLAKDERLEARDQE